jgi:ketosteroid isomerase-like protein
VGRAGVTAWKQGTDQLIAGVHVAITETFRSGDHAAIETVCSGHIHGAPKPFAVPITTILELKEGQITGDRNYYSLTTLLAQSELPLTWTPPAS